jgi:predicted nuclease of restriction endonuclease-like (RecB) superfamily
MTDKKRDNSKVGIGTYQEILQDVRGILHKGIGLAHRAVDRARVITYWKVGERMVQGELENKARAGYGDFLIKRIARDLGYSRYELSRMMNFYRAYPIVAEAPQQLSWAHIRELLPLESAKRQFYESKAVEGRWSSPQLRRAIKEELFENYKRTRRTLPVKRLPSLPVGQAIFKDSYHFNFLDLSGKFSERDLEDAILDRVIKVLTELGKYFSLVGRQVKILIDGNWDKIDLVFYHTRLHCYILVELKKGKFQKEYVGQINSYIQYYRHNEQSAGDNPTIGLILCEDIGYEEAIYALGGLEEKIFVAKYRLELPSERQIKEKMKRLDRE